ncbi:hypothetical protein [Schleiferia thermophila]
MARSRSASSPVCHTARPLRLISASAQALKATPGPPPLFPLITQLLIPYSSILMHLSGIIGHPGFHIPSSPT